ncbi:hypothetical protein SAICODRAFT_25198 [Saitoella complicata NRRL Y-17804]|nr:uncharacterized protein SAICODRAFT_25198 [Saitoella complicata NRRL Y-17804]ODQ53096.1 hypothetical protein SAICODRAFT_25198 [Saitoella complicata NRRL Y-17804]
MPTAEEEVKFLVTCIRCATNGKPNFKSVADEIGIKTGAASMRYTRLLKKYGAAPAAGTGSYRPPNKQFSTVKNEYGDGEGEGEISIRHVPKKRKVKEEPGLAYFKEAEEVVVKYDPEDGLYE